MNSFLSSSASGCPLANKNKGRVGYEGGVSPGSGSSTSKYNGGGSSSAYSCKPSDAEQPAGKRLKLSPSPGEDMEDKVN